MHLRFLCSPWKKLNKRKIAFFQSFLSMTPLFLGSTKALSQDKRKELQNIESIIVEASYETDPIPFGDKESDDGVVWVNQSNPAASLILGTSKFEGNPEGYGGLGVYTLEGRETLFLPKDRLNNIDIPLGPSLKKQCTHDRAIASNRTLSGISIFQISPDRVEKMMDFKIEDDDGKPLKVYGLCSAQLAGVGLKKEKRTLILLPTKSGLAYIYELKNFEKKASQISIKKLQTVDLKSFVTLDQDLFIKDVVEKSARADGELDELDKKLKDRFALEGCAYDHVRSRWLVGMENFGIWSVPEKSLRPFDIPTVILQVQGSWSDIELWSKKENKNRITDDIEGIDVFNYNGVDYGMFSIQGISEIGILELATNRLLGQFKVRLSEDNDPVLMTDGIAVKSSYLGPLFPKGAVILHDDKNESKSGAIDRANYKIVDLERIMNTFLK
jgi:myo-inositol-hexaphosphate 3-phosphohydrolase